MTIPRILTDYRPLIASGLSAALAGDSPLYPVLRYHVGLADEHGASADRLGKLLRPSLVLFTAAALGTDTARALPAAVALELIHNFSLIHDDIQDGDSVRRGRPTVWKLYGTAQGINAGDLMETIAIQEALAADPRLAAALLSATAEMIAGQALDLTYETREAAVDEYLAMIDKKTGALIRCAFDLGGIVAEADSATRAELTALGAALGRAFQIRDDILGIWGDDAITGKPHGSDIRRKKKSLPVVIGLARATGSDRDRLLSAYNQHQLTDADVAAVVEVMERLGVREASEQMAIAYLNQARDAAARVGFNADDMGRMAELIDYLARRQK